MTLFGKDLDELEVVTADFLPDGKKLYILVADSDCNLHVLQYDPEGTKTLLPTTISHTNNTEQTPNHQTATDSSTAANSTWVTSHPP